MACSLVRLPRDLDIYGEFEVYRNGVRQRQDIDFEIEDRSLVFSESLRKERISGWRWFMGVWGVGTYRQDDNIDVLYEVEGEVRLAHALAITRTDDDPTDDE